MAIAELFTDKEVSSQYRVEHIDDDGGCEVTVFAGPNALDRAIFFAGNWYDAWSDPEGLAYQDQKARDLAGVRLVRGVAKIQEYLEATPPRIGDALFDCEALLVGADKRI